MVWCRPELLAVLVAASSVVPAASGCAGQSSAGSASPHWLVPPVLPPGAFIAVVSGDPTRPGPFTLLVSMPNGYRIPPHSHPSYEHVEVKEGTLLVGLGDELDPKMTIEEAFPGRYLIVRIPLDQGSNGISVDHLGGQTPTKPGFPKQNVGIPEAPVPITVLFWEASPGCSTVIVNGQAFEKC